MKAIGIISNLLEELKGMILENRQIGERAILVTMNNILVRLIKRS